MHHTFLNFVAFGQHHIVNFVAFEHRQAGIAFWSRKYLL
jgi:hypothetical protein